MFVVVNQAVATVDLVIKHRRIAQDTVRYG